MAGNEERPMQVSVPDPALARFEKLVGTWEMRGRTLGAKEDDITGWNTFEWLPGGLFLKSVGEISFQGTTIESLEIIAYDPERKTFPSNVYSNLSGTVFAYEWDVQGDTVIHAGEGSKYTGTLSEDGNTLIGGWRPDEGTEMSDGNAYDAIMVRVK